MTEMATPNPKYTNPNGSLYIGADSEQSFKYKLARIFRKKELERRLTKG
ncbi:hypothetical protein ACFQRK_09530 [Parapedobacter sp. GCM10030251]